MKWVVFVFVAACLVATYPGITPVDAAEDVSMFCYVGNRSDNEFIGTVDVFDVRTGPNSCNVMYDSCGGNCTACYDDSDSREICMDSYGRVFYD
jgi:hypothetical protein